MVLKWHYYSILTKIIALSYGDWFNLSIA